jgi:hypothetical protein
LSGASGYRVDWNGLSFVWTGDGRPDSLTVEMAKGADIFVTELIPNLGVLMHVKSGFPDAGRIRDAARLYHHVLRRLRPVKDVGHRLHEVVADGATHAPVREAHDRAVVHPDDEVGVDVDGPKSLTSTATRSPWPPARMRLTKVVFPAPRNPVRMVTGVGGRGAIGGASWRRMPPHRSLDGAPPRYIYRLYRIVG